MFVHFYLHIWYSHKTLFRSDAVYWKTFFVLLLNTFKHVGNL